MHLDSYWLTFTLIQHTQNLFIIIVMSPTNLCKMNCSDILFQNSTTG